MQTKDKAGTDRPVVELKDVRLNRNRSLLENINWTVNRGEHWVVLGRNGAGKTLLLKILAGYLWPSRGEVNVLAERFGGVDLRELRQDIGWVSSALAEKIPSWDNALEVVLSGAFATFGLYREAPDSLVEKAQNLMDELGLSGLAGQDFSVLSAGEKQRVLLARARLSDPSLLILDEPCAGLDLASREKFLDLVEKMAEEPKGPTMIMVTHRASEIVPAITHGLLLRKGNIVASGPIDQVMTSELLSKTLEIDLNLSKIQGRFQVRIEK